MVAPYSRSEAWIYDRFIAHAVTAFQDVALAAIAIDVPTTATVLDVGCGGGQNAVALAGRFAGWTITGVDLSADQVARARKRAKDYGDRLSFVEGSALDLPFAAAAFDLVISIASIKHWPDQARGMREMVRVLKPGGRLLVVEADRGCRLDDCRRFVAAWNIPTPLHPVAVAAFRTYVAGQALDLDDARALLTHLGLQQTTVQRLPRLPALAFGGRKPASRARRANKP